MAQLVNCAVCGDKVATSASCCPHCGAVSFIPCETCGEAIVGNNGSDQVCFNHKIETCHYCGGNFYSIEGNSQWIIGWEWYDPSCSGPPFSYKWNSNHAFVCNSCSQDYPEPPIPRDKFLGLF